MKLTKTQQNRQKMAELEVENWNLKHPVGTEVTLRLDSGQDRATKTRSEAYVADCGVAACFFEGVSGYYLLDRATAVQL